MKNGFKNQCKRTKENIQKNVQREDNIKPKKVTFANCKKMMLDSS